MPFDVTVSGFTTGGVGLTASGVGLTASGVGFVGAGIGLIGSAAGLVGSGATFDGSGLTTVVVPLARPFSIAFATPLAPIAGFPDWESASPVFLEPVEQRSGPLFFSDDAIADIAADDNPRRAEEMSPVERHALDHQHI